MSLNSAIRFAYVMLCFLVPGVLSAQALHNTVSCTPGNAQTSLQFLQGGFFDWSTPGNLTQTFFDVGVPGQSVTYTFSGETNTLLPSPGNGLQTPSVDLFSNTYTDALSLLTSGIGNNKEIVIRIDFSPAIPGELGFEVYHINKSGGGDRVTLTAETVLGATINPAFTTPGSPDYQVQGQNRVNADDFNNVEDGQLGVNFSSPDSISSVEIIWEDCNGCPVAIHGLAIGDFTFCHRVYDNDEDGVENHLDVDDDNDGIPDITEVCGLPYGNPDQDTLDIEITLDGYPDETSWELLNEFGTKIVSGGTYNNPVDTGLVISERIILGADEDVIFRIYDSFGDALTSSPAGSYRILRNGAVEIGPVSSNWGLSSSEFISALSPNYDPFACIGGDYVYDDDADGIPNYQDANFCTLNSAGVCAGLDLDNDGVLDAFDKDTDNDGIPDAIESQGSSCYQAPSNFVDLLGLPINMGNYQNCGDNSVAVTYGVVPNIDGDDGDGIPDYQDLDTDGDGVADYAEGFDFDGDLKAVNDYIALAAGFVAGGGSVAVYPNGTDSDGDGIPNWLDNQPASAGFNQAQLPPFQTYGSSFFFDTDGDGIVDLFDVDNGGTVTAYPPDQDLDSDPDWRDIENNVSLPVEFASFDARLKHEREVLLQWNTSEEIKMSHFEIQRSQNGSDFHTIGMAATLGSGGTTGQYAFSDVDFFTQTVEIWYYRIVGVDQDGGLTTSETRAVQISPGNAPLDVKVYPNPAADDLNIQFIGLAEKVNLRLINGFGQEMWSQNLQVNGVLKLKSDLSGLPQGFYLLVVEAGNKKQVMKILH